MTIQFQNEVGINPDDTHVLTNEPILGKFIVSYWENGKKREVHKDSPSEVGGVVKELLRDGIMSIEVRGN